MVIFTGNYFRTPEMQTGKGFKCQNCNKSLAVKVVGPCEIHFHCPRCKAYITVKMREPVPWVPKKENGEKRAQA